jgi:integrase
MPGPERRAAGVPGAHALVGEYDRWLALDGHGSACYRNAAWAFLGRWPHPEAFASASLQGQLAVTASQRPFVTFLMLTDRLRPGYDYLAHRKIPGLLAQASRSPWAHDLTRFAAAATDLDYAGLVVKRTSERVLLRLLIQIGRPMSALRVEDLAQIADAFARCAATKGNTSAWANDRGLVAATHRVLFHLGVLPTPPHDPRQRHGLSGHYSSLPAPLRTAFLDYCAQAAATRAPATVKAIASHLAGFGRFLASCDPPVMQLADLHRHPHIEAWLATLAQARHPDGTPMSVGHRRGQILTVRQFLADITEWGWPDTPARPLLFARDIPPAPYALPRYLPPDADHRLQTVLHDVSDHHPSARTRLRADALLLTRATGLRIGELRDLELDCVHEIDGLGAWLKVPLGKLATERMVPVDEETLTVLDRIAARRTCGRPLPHPRTGRPVDFLLVHQGRRLSAQALRDELARACQTAGLPHHTPHALRHLRHSLGQLRTLPAGVDAPARARVGHDEPALRAPVRRHRPRRVRPSPRPRQEPAHHRHTGQRLHRPDTPPTAAALRRWRLEDQRHPQDPPGRRILPARTGPRTVQLRQHLRALPGLPHRPRPRADPVRTTRRHPRPGPRRPHPRLGRRGRPPPPTPRPP